MQKILTVYLEYDGVVDKDQFEKLLHALETVNNTCVVDAYLTDMTTGKALARMDMTDEEFLATAKKGVDERDMFDLKKTDPEAYEQLLGDMGMGMDEEGNPEELDL